MPAIIDSAPSCVERVSGAVDGDDADFILQSAYDKCAGIMGFGPGSVYGEEGASAATAYYVLTWIGIAVMVLALVAWVVVENRRLNTHVMRLRGRDGDPSPVAEP
jgi:hypothetical protein